MYISSYYSNKLKKGLLMILSLMALPLLFLAEARSQTPEEKGLEIAIEAEKRESGFGDFTSELNMTLRNRHGEESTRLIRVKTLEVNGDGDKSLSIFDTPRDVKGTAFLSFSHKEGPDDQWLYLPALKRVKRISSNNKSGPFMGSEFAFEDLSSQEVEKYTYKYLRNENLNGMETYVLERDPVDKKSGYTRQVVWYDISEYRPWKIDYYDRKNDLLKTLKYEDYRKYIDKIWKAHSMAMVNHQTGKSTLLTWKDYKFQNGYTDRDFNKNSLKNVR